MNVARLRLQGIINALGTTANAFARTHGLNVATIYGFLNGSRNPGFDTLNSICAAEPRISAEYLLRGEGEPLREQRQAADLTTVEQLRAFKEEIIQSLDKRIQELGG